jgi:hypothetical protein
VEQTNGLTELWVVLSSMARTLERDSGEKAWLSLNFNLPLDHVDTRILFFNIAVHHI